MSELAHFQVMIVHVMDIDQVVLKSISIRDSQVPLSTTKLRDPTLGKIIGYQVDGTIDTRDQGDIWRVGSEGSKALLVRFAVQARGRRLSAPETASRSTCA